MTHHAIDAPALPLDPASAATLAEHGLEYVTVAPGEPESAPFTRWYQAVARGFLDEQAKPEAIEAARKRSGDARVIAVLDPSAPLPDRPVATTECWVAELTTSPGRTIPAWAISSVTVSATHRRRGIARALLEGELRAAHAAGLAIAGLTVSESTIYGRYGFGAATIGTNWKIDARRAGWVGPEPVRAGRGRIDIEEPDTIEATARELFERVRLSRPGEMTTATAHYRWLAGTAEGHPNAKVRAVRYTDSAGALRGLLVFEIKSSGEPGENTLAVRALLAETDDAYAALWHFALTHDLVAKVTAGELSDDEPLWWMVADARALTVTDLDMHWLRILDVPAALAAREYARGGVADFVVVDPLGIAEGEFRLEIDDDGAARVTRLGPEAEAATRRVELGVAELGSLYLGGVKARTLLAAGRITTDPATAAWLDSAFAPQHPPQLSHWY